MKKVKAVTGEALTNAHDNGCSDVKKVLEDMYPDFFEKNQTFELGDMVKCINSKVTKPGWFAPKVIEGVKYIVKGRRICSCGTHYIDIGLANAIGDDKCMDCERKSNSGNILWVEPNRFKKIES